MKESKMFLALNVLNLIAVLTCLCCAEDPKCPIGSFLSGNKCELCPPGTYQNKKGATTCIPCPTGFFNKNKGAPGADICQQCKASPFSTVEGATSNVVCEPSPPGTSSPKGSDQCLSCPTGTFISKCPQPFETIIDANNVCLLCNSEYCETTRVAIQS